MTGDFLTDSVIFQVLHYLINSCFLVLKTLWVFFSIYLNKTFLITVGHMTVFGAWNHETDQLTFKVNFISSISDSLFHDLYREQQS